MIKQGVKPIKKDHLSTKMIWLSSKMNFRMFASGSKCEILNSVVSFVFIDMMNKFIAFQLSSKVFTHYKTMFKNMCLARISIWMFWVKNIYISTTNIFATFPVPMLFSYSIAIRFIKDILPFFQLLSFKFFTLSSFTRGEAIAFNRAIFYTFPSIKRIVRFLFEEFFAELASFFKFHKTKVVWKLYQTNSMNTI